MITEQFHFFTEFCSFLDKLFARGGSESVGHQRFYFLQDLFRFGVFVSHGNVLDLVTSIRGEH